MSAAKFAEAALTAGHQVPTVFFYHDAVNTASTLACQPQGELDPLDVWNKLSRDHSIELLVCIGASLRRGIIDETEARRYEKRGSNLGAEFELCGLGQLVDRSLACDRILTFRGCV